MNNIVTHVGPCDSALSRTALSLIQPVPENAEPYSVLSRTALSLIQPVPENAKPYSVFSRTVLSLIQRWHGQCLSRFIIVQCSA